MTRTAPFDHCNFTIGPDAPQEQVALLHTLLVGMSYDDPDVRPLCDLEGLKAWYSGRVAGYQALEAAVDDAHFYNQQGTITVPEYDY